MKRKTEDIANIMVELCELWLAHPNLRLAQLLGNYKKSDTYYLEDEEYIKRLKRFYKFSNMNYDLEILKHSPSYREEADIDEKTGKVSREHLDNCSGCDLCEGQDKEEYED